MQKYKVFINDKWIFFGEYKDDQFSDNEEYDVLNTSFDLAFNLSEMIKNGSFDRNIVLNQVADNQLIFDYFLQQFLVIEAAGGIVQNSSNSYLMIKRFGLWDFPKGKIEKGEQIKEAALREVQEETGVNNLEVLKELPTVFHIYRHGRKWIVKKTFWFLMQTNFTGKLEPQTEEEIIDAIWVPKADMTNYLDLSYGSLKEFIKDTGLLENH